MVEIAYLADCPEVIPVLVDWFRVQWPGYYAGRTDADIAEDFFAEAHRAGLPLRLTAFLDGELAGTITLRELAIWTSPEYRPGLGGLLVANRFRARGVGSGLVRAGMNLALRQGYERIYVTTATAEGILRRLGWEWVKTVSHGHEQLALYGCELGTCNQTPGEAIWPGEPDG